MNGKRIYLIAGEASGDLHASNVMRAILEQAPDTEFRFWGGDNMQAVGGTLVKHIRELAFMGFVEVLMNLRTILRNIKSCKEDIAAFKPDALILVDYPGFNLRIAEWAKAEGIPVFYYISPQVWAWKQSRVHKIRQVVDRMFVILPFEEAFYARFDYKVSYVGHPLLDAIDRYRSEAESDLHAVNSLPDKPIIALLPGSRRQEIRTKLPIMLKAVAGLDDYQVIIAGAPAIEAGFYEQFISRENRTILYGQTYGILSAASAALVTSGTATLETALFEVPEVVCYKGSPISYYIARMLIKVRFISLVNLIMDREVVTELIQQECNPKRIREELTRILPGGPDRERMLNDYKELRDKLGEGGASRLVAGAVLKTISA